MNKKALIAMSGGVDSSVAAWLMLQDGYSCIGAMMKLIPNELSEICSLEPGTARTCCSLEDAEDARNVAHRLGFPFYVFNFTEGFRRNVMDRFVSAYENGLTPNPCLDCNRYMKFGQLFQRAKELGCDILVTGHYARIASVNGRHLLKKGIDPKKDQSYVLYSMTQEQLKNTRFPLGTFCKERVRKIASEQGLLNAGKPDSQDICFVPDGNYTRFMESYTGRQYPPGDFVDLNGKRIGTHQGSVRYTIGQRKGLGIAFDHPLYVVSKNMEMNTVTLGCRDDLYSDELVADDLNWISIESLDKPKRVKAKIRYRQQEQPALIFPLSNGQVRVLFEEPQRAITPGQAVVFYDEDVVVGGGRILGTVTGSLPKKRSTDRIEQ